ncbi:mannitol dehydrogenase family protein [Enterococcus massiliensis]|uniref:mannitol dehydrogenase family protein n=1 Tax=Enterococcus massiliensis TaxID=1640685 RepID=UPI00065E71AF|nr:mannitol dehydrogenase family protein [Enterococcus massiliensis]
MEEKNQTFDELRQAGVYVPEIKLDELQKETAISPKWLHFGGGNLYRAFHAEIAQKLIEAGELSSGVVVCETFDEEVIDSVYQPYGNQILEVVMKDHDVLEKTLLLSTVESYFAVPDRPAEYQAVQEIFENPSLQLVTVTITEKGYSLVNATGDFIGVVEKDMLKGPSSAFHTMSIIASGLYARYKKNQAPIALVSTDNFSKNGLKFQQAILTIAKAWQKNNLVEAEFIDYVMNDQKVSFPWTMIDRITPAPSEKVAQQLKAAGVEETQIFHTQKGTNIATFSNTEETHYLVIEDSFPNGRPDFTKAGVILTDRDTVDKADAMKVTTCLNPLHTTLAVYGCVLGYQSIAEEMKDVELVKLIKGVGYIEGLPVVDDPKIIHPQDFIDELITKRLPNPMIPDTPQRIATDTSQKVAIRFGETIRKYMEDPEKDSSQLTYIPLSIAGWIRYLVGLDDLGEAFPLSPDPLLSDLQARTSQLTFGASALLVKETIQPILSNEQIFGVDLYEAGLGEVIEGYVTKLLAAPGAVRQTLKKELGEK